MKVLPTPIPGLILLEPRIFKDERGFFQERYRTDRLAETGIKETFVQDNHSRSLPGVVRGLHYQTDPRQGKLVGVIRGRIWDVAVDMRKGSATFGKHYGVELNDENGWQLWVPFGFAHGFCVLGQESADVIYQVNGYYNPKTEGGIRWNDPNLGIQWPVKNALVSPKDIILPTLTEVQPLEV